MRANSRRRENIDNITFFNDVQFLLEQSIPKIYPKYKISTQSVQYFYRYVEHKILLAKVYRNECKHRGEGQEDAKIYNITFLNDVKSKFCWNKVLHK